jgi:hypothetical protein
MLSSPSTVSSALPELDELDEEEEEEEEPPFSQMMKEFCSQQARGRTMEAGKEVADERESKRTSHCCLPSLHGLLARCS